MARMRRCAWCNNPIRKWIALNDSSDFYCCYTCQDQDQLAEELEFAYWVHVLGMESSL